MRCVQLSRLVAVCAATILLSGCLLTPGKFDSTLDIRADRSFTFTYKGEVIATDMNSGGMTSGPSGDDTAVEGKESAYRIALQSDDKAGEPAFGEKKEEQTAKMQAIAAALMKEKGFRSAVYKGDSHFDIDYAITGTLDHAFVWPFNSDAQAVFPFIAIELRADDRVRVKAPGYANSSKQSGELGGMGGGAGDVAAKALDGRFTLTTDAEIVSHNQEEGPKTVAGGKQLFWKIDPLTSDPPTAVIRFPKK